MGKNKKKKEYISEPISSEILNMYEMIPQHLLDNAENPNFDLHHIKLPFRMCIVAASGGGKTNYLLNMIRLFCVDDGTFISIQIISRNKDEPLYRFLETKSDQIKITEGLQSLPDLDSFDKDHNHLVVLDDLVLEKNLKPVEEYYIRCRKKNVSIIFISQSYFRIPKLIRSNCSYLVLLKLSGTRDIRMILSECGLGLTAEELYKVYEYATAVKLTPLVIDLEEAPDKRFRKGFLEIINPSCL